jgi:hypothetical protein
MKWWRSLLVVAVLCGGCGKTEPGKAAPAVAPKSDYQKLVGKWLRPDGGYVIEIKSVAADGKMEAGYFNPNPIHVSQAAASREGSVTKVFIELRDENYPGCTYKLTYDPGNDRFSGVYFQASQQQFYNIEFIRTE